MPSFLKDIRSQVRRKSAIFARKDNGSSTDMTAIPPSQSSERPTMSSLAPPEPQPYLHSNTPPSPDSFTPPASDAESDSGPSVSGATGSEGSTTFPTLQSPAPSRPPSSANRLSMISTASPPPLKRRRVANFYPPQQSGTVSTPRFADPLAPRVTNFADGAHCTQKLLLLNGRIGEESNRLMQGNVTVSYPHNNTFPSQSWPVVDSRFKALVMLQPGGNKIRIDFVKKSSQLSLHGSNPSKGVHTTYLNVVNLPKNHVAPLHLAILVARDSKGTYDAMPGEIQRDGNDLNAAVRKFRVVGLLWQAFVAEQMRRHGFGMRTFRLDEEWGPGTVAAVDDYFTNEVKVHIIRLQESVDDIRNLEYAQQYEQGRDRGKLHSIATNACQAHFNPPPGCPQHVAAMFLDTHWDPKAGVIRGHAALGAGSGDIRVGVFGSHALHAYPSNLASVTAAFSDATPTDTKYVANDVGRSGTTWEAACIGLAAHLHEAGHALGLPHEVTGIMAADYSRFNRTFCVWEGYRSATGERGQAILDESQESAFHQLSALRLSSHPCFLKPGERPLLADSVQVFALGDHLLITASSGIAWIEYYDGDNEPCKHYESYLKSPKREYQMTLPRNLRPNLPQFLQKSSRLRLKIYSQARGEAVVDDFDKLFTDGALKIGAKKVKAFRSHKVGHGQMEGSRPEQVLFTSFGEYKTVLNGITVYHGDAVDGVEFHYEDKTSQLFGKRGGVAGGTKFELQTRIGEQLHGFILRTGLWIDAIQIITTHSRKSRMFGNPHGGGLQLMTPPVGYHVAGLAGSCGAWLDSFQLIISR